MSAPNKSPRGQVTPLGHAKKAAGNRSHSGIDLSALDRGWSRSLRKIGDTNKIAPTLYNVETILIEHERYKDLIRYDEFTHTKTFTHKVNWRSPGPYEDVDTHFLRSEFEVAFEMKVSLETMLAAVETASKIRAYDSLKDFVRSCKWDGVSRIDTFFIDYFGVDDTPANRRISRVFLIAAVARALRPGCKVDFMVVLEGLQGVGKSTAIEALCGREFFSDDPVDVSSKEGAHAIASGVWIVEMAELEPLKRARDSEQFKAYLSKRKDRYRPPYGRETVERLRRCIFVGTTNHDEYLKDSTGDRRFYPMLCRFADAEGIRKNRTLLIGEAVHFFDAGEKFHITEQEAAELGIIKDRETRRESDIWDGIVDRFLSGPTLRPEDGVTARQILEDAIKMDVEKMTARETARITHMLRRFGYRPSPHRIMKQGNREKVWFRADIYEAAVAEQKPKATNESKQEEDKDEPF